MTFIYVLKLIPRLQGETALWTEADERLVNDHFTRLKQDREHGKVRFAGRTEATDASGLGIVLFEADTFEEALSYTASDPAVKGGVMTATCQPFRIAIGSVL